MECDYDPSRAIECLGSIPIPWLTQPPKGPEPKAGQRPITPSYGDTGIGP